MDDIPLTDAESDKITSLIHDLYFWMSGRREAADAVELFASRYAALYPLMETVNVFPSEVIHVVDPNPNFLTVWNESILKTVNNLAEGESVVAPSVFKSMIREFALHKNEIRAESRRPASWAAIETAFRQAVRETAEEMRAARQNEKEASLRAAAEQRDPLIAKYSREFEKADADIAEIITRVYSQFPKGSIPANAEVTGAMIKLTIAIAATRARPKKSEMDFFQKFLDHASRGIGGISTLDVDEALDHLDKTFIKHGFPLEVTRQINISVRRKYIRKAANILPF